VGALEMCGIVGLIDKVTGHVSPHLLNAMRDVMVRRGPDGEGHYFEGAVGMAMRRLSVIDISGGNQPFFDRTKQIVAFQNGEIYNYRQLRRELIGLGHIFSSQSDTEILAHGFAQWGAEELLRRVDGMYATAILDRKKRELHLARDRFGEKPLFYAHAEGRFAYSSNLLVLATLPWVNDELDPLALERYLALHYVPGSSTIIKAIKRVLPGERLVVSLDDPKPRCSTYYRAPLEQESRISDDDLADIVEEAVESRLVADVPVGVFLSGGLDSSLIAAIAAKKNPNISTFSMGFESAAHDESGYANLVASHIGASHHHFVFNDDSFQFLLPKVASDLDEPVGDQAQLPLHWLCQQAREHVTVALSGEAADEIFAGYSYYRQHVSANGWRTKLKALVVDRVSHTAFAQTLIDNPEVTSPSGFPLLTDTQGRDNVLGTKSAKVDEWERNLFTWLDTTKDSLRRATATDLASWLPDDLLVKFDRMAMAHSLEGRAPYLYPRLVECGLKLPQTQKIKGDISKVALRRIAKRWLPHEILERPKQGFVLPMRTWLINWFAAQGCVYDYFRMRALPGLRGKELADLVTQDLHAGVQRERLLFAIVLLTEWYQSFKAKQYNLARTYRETARSDQPVNLATAEARVGS
jgi:asparagine synthase (glutamine-hydrolysing)